jgi:hypothetical protein
MLDHVKCNLLLMYLSDLEDHDLAFQIRNWRFDAIKTHRTCMDII